MLVLDGKIASTAVKASLSQKTQALKAAGKEHLIWQPFWWAITGPVKPM